MVLFVKAKSTLTMPSQAQNIQGRVHWESKAKRMSWLVRGPEGTGWVQVQHKCEHWFVGLINGYKEILG